MEDVDMVGCKNPPCPCPCPCPWNLPELGLAREGEEEEGKGCLDQSRCASLAAATRSGSDLLRGSWLCCLYVPTALLLCP